MTAKHIAVAAVSENFAIAVDSGLPWETNENDLRRYKERVSESPLIVGRTTYEALIKYNNRYIYDCPAAVLTTNESYEPIEDHHTVVHSKEEAMDWLEGRDEEIVYNVGGGQVYDLFLDTFDEIVLSHMPVTAENPTATFPEIEEADWKAVTEECFEDFSIIRYRRN